MDKADNQEMKSFIAEAERLVAGGFDGWIKSEIFIRQLGEINQRMVDRLGISLRDIGTVVKIEILTGPPVFEGEEVEEDRKPGPSVNIKFGFGGSSEDEEIGKMCGIEKDEMNRLIEQARGGKAIIEEDTPSR